MNPVSRCSGLAILGVLLSFSSLPLANAASKTTLWESGDQIVEFSRQADKSAGANNHPATISTKKIAAMLTSLHLRYKDDDSELPSVAVFTNDEVANLSSAVAAGLKRAKPNQDITFHVVGAHSLSRGTFLRRNRVSTGRIFVSSGKLNILFGQIQEPYRKKNVYGQTDQDFYPRTYGSRKKAEKHEVSLQTNASVSFHKDKSGELRLDWLELESGAAATHKSTVNNLEDSQPAPPVTETAEVPVAPTPVPVDVPAVPARPEAQEVEVAPQAILADPKPPPNTGDVEARLEALKQLRERKLISEEAYHAKMKEILRDL